MSIVISIVVSLLVLMILVVLHEGGHFFMGKWLGFKINEFSVGMGPKLFSKEKNGTVYSLRAFPIGGMCAFEGEDQDSESDEPGLFNKMPAWKRLLVTLAGPFMNLVAAVLFAIIMLAIFGQYKTVNSVYPIISDVTQNEPAAVAGVLPGDIIVAVNGKSVKSTNTKLGVDLLTEAIKADKDGEITLIVQRLNDNSCYVINGKEVDKDADIEKFVKDNKAAIYSMEFKNTDEIKITVKDCFDEKAGYSRIGVALVGSVAGYEQKYNVITAVPAGFRYVGDTGKMMIDFLGQLFTGKLKTTDVSGIVGVVDVVNDGVSSVIEEDAITEGEKIAFILEFIFVLTVLLSLNLSIMNLLPLPALDGGRIFFNLIEIIARKPIPAKVEGWIHTVGFVLLLALIALITVKDVFYLFK